MIIIISDIRYTISVASVAEFEGAELIGCTFYSWFCQYLADYPHLFLLAPPMLFTFLHWWNIQILGKILHYINLAFSNSATVVTLINRHLDYLWCVWNMMVTGDLIWQNVVYQRLKINGEIWHCAQYIEGQLEYKIETQLRFTILPKYQVLKMKFSEPQSSRTTDTQRGNSLHCTAENSIPIPNF